MGQEAEHRQRIAMRNVKIANATNRSRRPLIAKQPTLQGESSIIPSGLNFQAVATKAMLFFAVGTGK
jgi:hypothetical protein